MAAESLRFEDGCFDLVISRLVLPYTEVRRALTEMARVVRPGGLLVLQIHAPRYYWRQWRHRWWSPKWGIYYLRPILVWILFMLTGAQLKRHGRCFETALTTGMLSRISLCFGLSHICTQGFSARPSMVLRKG